MSRGPSGEEISTDADEVPQGQGLSDDLMVATKSTLTDVHCHTTEFQHHVINAVREKPLQVMAVAAMVGFALGALSGL